LHAQVNAAEAAVQATPARLWSCVSNYYVKTFGGWLGAPLCDSSSGPASDGSSQCVGGVGPQQLAVAKGVLEAHFHAVLITEWLDHVAQVCGARLSQDAALFLSFLNARFLGGVDLPFSFARFVRICTCLSRFGFLAFHLQASRAQTRAPQVEWLGQLFCFPTRPRVTRTHKKFGAVPFPHLVRKAAPGGHSAEKPDGWRASGAEMARLEALNALDLELFEWAKVRNERASFGDGCNVEEDQEEEKEERRGRRRKGVGSVAPPAYNPH
jgi:hypothetical protein